MQSGSRNSIWPTYGTATLICFPKSSLSNLWAHDQSLNHVRLFVTPWAVACQAPLSLGFSRQEYRSGLPCPPPGDLPDPVIESVSPVAPELQAASVSLSYLGFPQSSVDSNLYIWVAYHQILWTSWILQGKVFLYLKPILTEMTPTFLAEDVGKRELQTRDHSLGPLNNKYTGRV